MMSPIGIVVSPRESSCISRRTAFTNLIEGCGYRTVQFDRFIPRNPQPLWMQMSAQWWNLRVWTFHWIGLRSSTEVPPHTYIQDCTFQDGRDVREDWCLVTNNCSSLVGWEHPLTNTKEVRQPGHVAFFDDYCVLRLYYGGILFIFHKSLFMSETMPLWMRPTDRKVFAWVKRWQSMYLAPTQNYAKSRIT